MPGVIAGIIGCVMAAIATEEQYHQSLNVIFPARAAVDAKPTSEFPRILPGLGRSAGEQAGYQILAVIVTMLIAIVSGAITGKKYFILYINCNENLFSI